MSECRRETEGSMMRTRFAASRPMEISPPVNSKMAPCDGPVISISLGFISARRARRPADWAKHTLESRRAATDFSLGGALYRPAPGGLSELIARGPQRAAPARSSDGPGPASPGAVAALHAVGGHRPPPVLPPRRAWHAVSKQMGGVHENSRGGGNSDPILARSGHNRNGTAPAPFSPLPLAQGAHLMAAAHGKRAAGGARH